MEKDLDHQKELQLLPPPPPLPRPPPTPTPTPTPSSSRALPWLNHRRSSSKPPLYPFDANSQGVDPTLDLQLGISLDSSPHDNNSSCVEALKWQAAEQIRLAAIEKAYAERVRELTRREIELAQSEFARARATWDKAREEVAKAERLRDSAANSCMGEITCHSCRQRLRSSGNKY